MTHFKHFIILFFSITIGISCTAQKDLKSLEFMIGTWKIESKTTYESWKMLSDSEFTGKSFKSQHDQVKILETLRIRADEDQIIYEATVTNQNEGRTIRFILSSNEKTKLSFENLSHDFPKKIQYTSINPTKMFVEVLGSNDDGFSYFLIKQED
ncbi:MAG: DUF6265 family protein [Bacteroidota bacterium]